MAKGAGRGRTEQARRAGRAGRIQAELKQTTAGRALVRRATSEEILARQVEEFDRRDLLAPGGYGADARRSADGSYGASGTPNWGGYIIGEDYNPKVDGHQGLRIWDEMRRSCAPAQASLLIINKPIQSSSFVAVPPEGGDQQDQAIADLVNACLFDDDAMDDPWTRVLEHLLMRHAMGFSVVEKIWTLDDAGVMRPRRLAPRLPHTFRRFVLLPDGSGNLRELRQWAVKNDQYGELTIPGEYAMITVHAREGDNYWGRSVFRSAYMHWFYLTQFYKIDAVRLWRFGAGIPTAQLSKDHGETSESLAKIERILKGMQTHQQSYLMAPPGVEFKITVPSADGGRGGAAGLLDSVVHHADMIMANVLAAFVTAKGGDGIGSQRTEALAGVFSNLVEGEALAIASDLKRQVVREICDLNFNMRGRTYPRIVPRNVMDVDMKALSEELKDLVGCEVISPDDDIEDAVRKVMKLPPMPKYLRGRREEDATTPPTPPTLPTPPTSPTGPGDPADPEAEPAGADPAPPDPTAKDARALRLRWRDPDTGVIFGREPTATERKVFDLRNVPNRLGSEAADLAEALAEIRAEQLSTLAAAIAQKDARDHTGAFTDIRPDNFAVPQKAAAARAIKASQTNVAEYGALQVRKELRRQGLNIAARADLALVRRFASADAYDRARVDLARKKKGGITPEGANPTAASGKQAQTSAITSSSKVAGERLNDEWFNRIMDRAVQLRRTGLQGDELKDAIVAALAKEATAAKVLPPARAEVNEAFAIGRATEAEQLKDQIDVVQYSALLDEDTCDVCAAADGDEMALGSGEYYASLPPNKDCEGNNGRADACRCVDLYLLKDRTT